MGAIRLEQVTKSFGEAVVIPLRTENPGRVNIGAGGKLLQEVDVRRGY